MMSDADLIGFEWDYEDGTHAKVVGFSSWSNEYLKVQLFYPSGHADAVVKAVGLVRQRKAGDSGSLPGE